MAQLCVFNFTIECQNEKNTHFLGLRFEPWAIFMPEVAWPREIRPYFANPYAGHWHGIEGAKPPPDIKLNDITGRIQEGMTAVVIEVGRPGTSTIFRDVQKVCMALARQCECGIFNPHRAERLLREMV